MKILLCHNFYQQPGGEDLCFAAEGSLLESQGHQVLRFTRHNAAIVRMKRFDVVPRTLWNRDTFHGLRELIRRERPSVMHCTNILPLISPAAYYAARVEGVPIVQSLRNYRLFCLNACFLRNDRVCEHCLGKGVPWPGFLHGCYRSSRTASAVVAATLSLHRGMRTWTRMVDRYYTLTEFSRRKFIEGGSLGDGRRGLYEPIHGSAPDIAGEDKAYPTGAILSGAMLLRFSLNEEAAARAIERAVEETIAAGCGTIDIGGRDGCAEFAERVVFAVRR